MQLTENPVKPQVGGASPPKPDVAQELPVIDSVDGFAKAYVGTDASAFIPEKTPEKTISPDALVPAAPADVPVARPNRDVAPPLPFPQSATERGVPQSSAVVGEKFALEPGRPNLVEPALNAGAKLPTSPLPAPPVGPSVKASADPATPEAKAAMVATAPLPKSPESPASPQTQIPTQTSIPILPKTHSAAPDRPVSPQSRTDAATPPKPPDHSEIIRPRRDPDTQRTVADVVKQPARSAAPVAPAQLIPVPDDTAASQVIAPKSALASSDRVAEITAAPPKKPPASAADLQPAPKIDVRHTNDAPARPVAEPAPPMTPRQATRDWQSTADRPLPPDAPAWPKPRETALVRETAPVREMNLPPIKGAQTPVIDQPAIRSTAESPARHSPASRSAVGLAAQPTVTLPTVTLPTFRPDPSTPQPTPIVLPGVASDPGKITVEIVTLRGDRQPSSAADRAVPALPRPMSAFPHPTLVSPQPPPGLPQPTLEAPQPAPPLPIQMPMPMPMPMTQGIDLQVNPTNTQLTAKPAPDTTPPLPPSNNPTARSDPDRAPRIAAPQARAGTPTQTAPPPVAPIPPMTAAPEIFTGSIGQNGFERVDQLLTAIGSDGPLSTDRTQSLNVAHRTDAGLARAELARSVAAQIGDAARATVDGRIEVRLSPEELGRVRLSMVQSEHGMSVTITAERAETLELIRRNTDLFAQDLRHLGHQNIDFSFEHQADQQGSDQDADTPENKSDNPETSSNPGSPHLRASGQINDGRLDIRL